MYLKSMSIKMRETRKGKASKPQQQWTRSVVVIVVCATSFLTRCQC